MRVDRFVKGCPQIWEPTRTKGNGIAVTPHYSPLILSNPEYSRIVP